MTKINPFTLKAFMNNQPVIKALLFGQPKTGKTTFASKLFELTNKGYHIIYIDCDKSMNVVRKSDIQDMDKITYVELRDNQKVTIHPFIFYLVSKKDFFYNPNTGHVTESMTFIKGPDQKDYIPIYASRIDKKTIIVLDSLTGLAESMFNTLREKQGYAALTFDMDKLYGNKVQQFYGVLSTEFAELMDRIGNLDCSLFMIAHTRTIEKRDRSGNVTSTMTYPLATTTPSAETLSKYFDECLFFSSRANTYYISAQPSANLCGVGGRLVEPKEYKSADFNILTLLNLYNFDMSQTGYHQINLVEAEENKDNNDSDSKLKLTTNKITI